MMSRYLAGQPVTTRGHAVGPGMMANRPGMMGSAYGCAPAAGSTGGSSTAAIVGAAALGTLVIVGALALTVPRMRAADHEYFGAVDPLQGLQCSLARNRRVQRAPKRASCSVRDTQPTRE